MRIYTVQLLSVLDTIERTGAYHTDESKSVWVQDDGGMGDVIKTAYEWMSNNMVDKIGLPPSSNIKFPVWGWYRINGRNDFPDINEPMFKLHDNPGTEVALFELEIPESRILLSDHTLWTYSAFSGTFLNSGKTEEEINNIEKAYSSLHDPEEILLETIKSWDNIFIINPMIKTDFYEQGYDVQATFWEIRKEDIVSVTKYTCESCDDFDYL